MKGKYVARHKGKIVWEGPEIPIVDNGINMMSGPAFEGTVISTDGNVAVVSMPYEEYLRIEARIKELERLNAQLLIAANHYEDKGKTLEAGIKSVVELIDDSEGVYGLHLNGDGAPWDSLRTGGSFEEWLLDFDKAQEPAK
jgi:hypothetical protein